MRPLRERLARLEAANREVEFWLDLGDSFVTCGRTGEQLSRETFRLRFGSQVFTFTFEVESAGARR